MDILVSILNAPINTILILAGLIFIFLSIFDVSKSAIGMRQEKTIIFPLAIGAVLLLGGIFYNPGNIPPPQPTEAPVGIPTTQPPVVVTEPPAATEAPTVTAVPTSTLEPTSIPAIKTILDGCFSAQTWKASSINADALNSISTQDDCLKMNSLGISVDPGGAIRLLATASTSRTASGISMPVTDQSAIEFKFTVTNLYTVYLDESAYITFAVAPLDDPMAERGSGRLKLVVDKSGNEQTVFYFLANAEQSTGSPYPSQHPSYRRTYSVRLQLKSISMEIYLDGIKLRDEVTIPPGTKVFYIGYYLPVQAGTDITITDLTVNGVSP